MTQVISLSAYQAPTLFATQQVTSRIINPRYADVIDDRFFVPAAQILEANYEGALQSLRQIMVEIALKL